MKKVAILVLTLIVAIGLNAQPKKSPQPNKGAQPDKGAQATQLVVKLFQKSTMYGGPDKFIELKDFNKSKEAFVDYGAQVKIQLLGNMNGLSMRITDSKGKIVYKNENFNLVKELTVADNGIEPQDSGEGEGIQFVLTITQAGKVIFTGKLISVPGGE